MMDHFDDIDAAFANGTSSAPPPPPPSAAPTGMADIDHAFASATPAAAPAPSLKAMAKDSAVQAAVGPVVGTAQVLGTPGDLQAMNTSMWDRLSTKAIHGLLHFAGQIKTPEDEAHFNSLMSALSSDGSGVADQALKQAGVPSPDTALPTSQQTTDALTSVTGPLPAPQTTVGKYVRAATSMAPAVLVGGEPLLADGALQAGKRLALEGAAPGIGAQFAEDETTDPTLKPLTSLVGGVAGGLAPGAAAGAIKRVAEIAPIAGGLDKVGISGPAQTRAAKQFVRTASDPAAVRDALANPPNSAGAAGTQFASVSAPDGEGGVTFAQPGTGEYTQDPGLLVAQRGDMAKNTADYLPQLAQNNQTRLAAMGTDLSANPQDVATHVQGQLSAIHDDADAKLDQAKEDAATSLAQAQDAAQSRLAATDQTTQAAVDQAKTAQTAAAEPIRGAAPEVLGEAMRQPLADLNAEAKAREGALHEAIDPDNSLVASTQPIVGAMEKAYGGLSPTAQAFISPAEKQFASLISDYDPTVSYREAADLSSNLAAAMRQERATNQGITPAYRRMAMMMDGVKGALNDTVRQKAIADASDVALGRMAPEDAMQARYRQWMTDGPGTIDAEGTARRSGTDAFDISGERTPSDLGGSRAATQASGQRGQGARNPGLPSANGSAQDQAPRPVTPAQRGPRPQSLISFLQRAGGVRDQGGNLKAAGLDRYPGLVTKNGLPLDRAREMAAEAGYLGHDTAHAVAGTDINDLLDAIGSHPRYSTHDEGAVADREQRANEVAYQKQFAAARREVQASLKRDHGFTDQELDPRLLNHAAYNFMEGGDPLDAYDLAVRRDVAQNPLRMTTLYNEALPEERGFDFDGEFAGEDTRASEVGERTAQTSHADPAGRGARKPSPGGQEPAFGRASEGDASRFAVDPDPETAERIRAANAATRERKNTFERGAVGEVLRSGPVAGQYRLSDSQVPAKVFQPGPKGGDAVRGYLTAAGAHPQAVPALHNAAISELAKIVEKNDGILTDAGLTYWKRRYGDALRAIDEHTPGFSSRFNTAAAATEEVERHVGARAEAMRAAEKEGTQAVRDADAAGRQNVKETAAAGKQAAKDYQQGVVGKLVTARNPEAVVAHLKTMLKDAKLGVPEADRILEAVKGNPEAEAALRNGLARAFAEHITGSVKVLNSDVPMVKAGASKLFDQALPVLRKILPEEHVTTIRKAVADAQRQEALFSGTKLPGGSNTVQDTAAAGKHGGGHGGVTFGQLAMLEFVGEHLVKHIPGAGQAMVAGGAAIRALRNMGVNSTQKYFEQMLRNPEFAAQMVKRVSPSYDMRQGRITGLIRKALIRGSRPDDDPSPPGAPNEPPPTGPFSRDGSRARAIDVRGPADLEPARARVDVNASPAQAEAGNHRMGHVVIDGMPVSIQAPKGSMRSGVGRDGKPWSAQMPADYGYFKGSKGVDGEHVDTYIGERPSQGVAHIVDQVDPDTKRFDEHKVVLNAGDADHARELYKQAFSDGRGEQRIGGVTPVSTDALKDWLGSAQPKRPYATSRFAKQNPARVEPTLHPDAEATHQAILAHEQRLKTKLGPDASIKDIADATRRASDDVLAMVRAYHGTPHDVDRFDISKIGTGEGNQVYGHGLYFAENPDVAEGYRRQLSVVAGDHDFKLLGQSFKRGDLQGETRSTYDHIVEAGSIGNAIKEAREASASKMRQGDMEAADYWAQRATRLEDWQGNGFSMGSGNTYQVAIDREPEHFLDWDKPLSEQSPHVQAALKQHARTLDRFRKGGFYTNPHASRGEMSGELIHGALQERAYRNGQGDMLAKHQDSRVAAAKALQEAGIAGIRYHDAGSRHSDPATGTRNYVVFDDKDIKITHRNGEPVAPADREQALASMRPAAQARPAAASDAAQPGLTLRNPRTGASVKARGSISLGGALERYDVSRDAGADNLQRVSHLAVGDRVSRLAGNTPVFVVGPNEMRALAEGRLKVDPGHEPAGFYDPESGHIIALDDAMRDPREASRLMLHEGLHAALMRTIDGSQNLREMVDHLRLNASAVHFERGGEASDHYGLKNAHEFMSEAMSNPEFQRFLASIPADNRLVRAHGLQGTARTMWDAFVGAMRRVLGVAPGDHTYLDAAMKAGWDALDTAEAEKAAARPPLPAAAAPPRATAPAPMRPRPPPGPPPIGAMQGGSPMVSMLATLMARDHRNVPVENYR